MRDNKDYYYREKDRDIRREHFRDHRGPSRYIARSLEYDDSDYDIRYEYRDRERELYELERNRERELERESLLQRLEYHTPMSFEQALAMGRTGILPSPILNGYKQKGLVGGMHSGRHSDSDEEDWC